MPVDSPRMRTVVPAHVMDAVYDWTSRTAEQRARAKEYLTGRTDVCLSFQYHGDVSDGSAYIECTVFEPYGLKGNLYILGTVTIHAHGCTRHPPG